MSCIHQLLEVVRRDSVHLSLKYNNRNNVISVQFQTLNSVPLITKTLITEPDQCRHSLFSQKHSATKGAHLAPCKTIHHLIKLQRSEQITRPQQRFLHPQGTGRFPSRDTELLMAVKPVFSTRHVNMHLLNVTISLFSSALFSSLLSAPPFNMEINCVLKQYLVSQSFQTFSF